jgi:hypothetical protein
MKTLLTAAFIALAGTAAFAQPIKPKVHNPIFAQKLVDDFTAKYVNLISVGIHAKPPGASNYMIVAHTLAIKVGDPSTQTDMDTMRTGQPDGPSALEGSIYDVALPLLDASGKTIGVVAEHLKPHKGDPKDEALRLALKYRDELAKLITSNEKLFEPVN